MSKKRFRPRGIAASHARYPTWSELSTRRSFLTSLGAVVAGASLTTVSCDDGPHHTAGKVDTMRLPDEGIPDLAHRGSLDAGAGTLDSGPHPSGPEGGLIPLADHGRSGQPPALDVGPPAARDMDPH